MKHYWLQAGFLWGCMALPVGQALSADASTRPLITSSVEKNRETAAQADPDVVKRQTPSRAYAVPG